MISSLLDFHNQLIQAKGVDAATGFSCDGQRTRFDSFSSLLHTSKFWPTTKTRALLDYGCATGDFFEYLSARELRFRYYGIDVNDAFLCRAKERFGYRVKLRRGDFCDDSFFLSQKERYKIVFASGVFCYPINQHLHDLLLDRLWSVCTDTLIVNFLVHPDFESQTENPGMVYYSLDEVMSKILRISPFFSLSKDRFNNVSVALNHLPERYRNHDLRVYGITSKDYDRMSEKQGGVCAICKKPEKSKNGRLCVDHCHLTGKVRGLLCGNCNTGIGKLGEDIAVLEAAIRYIRGGDAR